MLKDFVRRALVVTALTVSVFTLVRVIFPGAFEFWANTYVGRQSDQFGASLIRWLLQPGSPLVPIVDTFALGVMYVKMQLTTGNLISAILGALGVGVFNLTYNWIRNRSIRRMCSAMLYSASYRILENIFVIYRASKRNGKPYLESFDDGAPTKTLTLLNNKDARGAFHRLKCEMETLQDFSIAYDYAIWRGLRFLTARVRIRAMAIREALEVVAAELDFDDHDQEVNVRPARLGVTAAMRDGFEWLDVVYSLYPALSVSVELAERLEVGFIRSFLLWWWPATGASMPSSAPKLRAAVKKFLIDWRHDFWKRAQADPDSWDILWIASSGEDPHAWYPRIRQLVRSTL